MRPKLYRPYLVFKRTPGKISAVTCEWLHKCENFSSWLDGPDRDYIVLWFTGMPGSGKSTLAAKTILRIQDDRQCQYHFFIGAQPVKLPTASGLLLSSLRPPTLYLLRN